MSAPSRPNARLRQKMDPFIQSLPANVLHDMAGSLLAGIWSSLLAEGHPVPDVVGKVTGLPPGEALDELVTRVLYTDFKNRCLTHAWRVAGLDSVMDLIHCPDAERLREFHQSRRPAVFVFSHFGPRYAVAPAFQGIKVPVAMFQGSLPPPLKRHAVERFAAQLPGMEYYWIDEPNNRAIHLKRAVERLQRGGFVASAIDGGHGDMLAEAEFLGHRIQVARGPGVLARLTGAPLVPITIAWEEGWSMEFRVHEPITVPEDVPANSPEFELALIRGAVRFFDGFLRQNPEQLRLDRVARLMTLPKAG